MAEIIDYSAIGIFDSTDTLIAFGPQDIKFAGSVTVGISGGKTVVTVGAGSSVIVEQAGVPVLVSGTLNFIGATVVNNAGVADITIIPAAPSGVANAVAFFNNLGVLSSVAPFTFLSTPNALSFGSLANTVTNAFDGVALGVNNIISTAAGNSFRMFAQGDGNTLILGVGKSINSGGMLGIQNTITVTTPANVVGIYLIGQGLKNQPNSGQVIVGSFNDPAVITPLLGTKFEVGTGTSDATRDTAFAVLGSNNVVMKKATFYPTVQSVSGGFTVDPKTSYIPLNAITASPISAATAIGPSTYVGQMIVIHNISPADTITLKNSVNVKLPGAVDLVLNPNDTVTLIGAFGGSGWVAIAHSVN